MLLEIEKYITDNYENDYNDYNKLYEKLINIYKSDIEKQEIKFIMYDKFLYKFTNKELKNKRDEQEEFRQKLIGLDKNCVISDQ